MSISTEQFLQHSYEQYLRASREKERYFYEQQMQKAAPPPRLMPRYEELPPGVREAVGDGMEYALTRGQHALLAKKRTAEIRAKELAEQREEQQLQALITSPAMTCTLTDAVNLWIAKFGDGWVRSTSISETAKPETGGMNWVQLHMRLRDAQRMESQMNHYRIIT